MAPKQAGGASASNKKSQGTKGPENSGSKSSKKPADGKNEPSQGAGDEQKKPTAKQIIGGASWTGKLPVNMLSEHCQKQQWERPEYKMV